MNLDRRSGARAYGDPNISLDASERAGPSFSFDGSCVFPFWLWLRNRVREDSDQESAVTVLFISSHHGISGVNRVFCWGSRGVDVVTDTGKDGFIRFFVRIFSSVFRDEAYKISTGWQCFACAVNIFVEVYSGLWKAFPSQRLRLPALLTKSTHTPLMP